MTDPTAATLANTETPDMVDMVFDLNGSSVPLNYPFALWSEAVRYLPWLSNEANAGFIPLKGSVSGETLLLSKRTKLILRLPASLAAQSALLAGKQLNIAGNLLTVGTGKERPLLSTTTLHAYLVESNLGEIEFLSDMKQKLQDLNISCNLICDKQRKISNADQSLSGFGLVLHDLKPLASIQIQCIGLGGARHFGCGIFVPFKAISGLD